MRQIVVMTPEQLREFVAEAARAALDAGNAHTDEETAPGKRYVYGLRGIRDLFNVSHPTAQKYKNTFLAPAIMQRGRKIIIDVAKAMELYNNRQQWAGHHA